MRWGGMELFLRDEVVFKLIDKSPPLDSWESDLQSRASPPLKIPSHPGQQWDFWKWLCAMSLNLINGLIPWWAHEMVALLGCDAYLEIRSPVSCPRNIQCSPPSPVAMYFFLAARKWADPFSTNSWHHEFLPHLSFKAIGPANLRPKLHQENGWCPSTGTWIPPPRTQVQSLCAHMCMGTQVQTMDLDNLGLKLLKLDSMKPFLFLNWS